MAFGHTRLDARRPPQPSYCTCSTTAAVVALCLVAVWMTSSMLVTPAEFSPFQPKVRPLAPRDSPPFTGGLTNAPVSAEETTDDDQQQNVREQVKHRDEQSASELKKKLDENEQVPNEKPSEVFPDGSQAELLNETTTERGPWPTQAAQSNKDTMEQTATSSAPVSYSWKLCNVDARADYIPCLDNLEAIKKLHSTKHYEHRERHCPECKDG